MFHGWSRDWVWVGLVVLLWAGFSIGAWIELRRARREDNMENDDG